MPVGARAKYTHWHRPTGPRPGLDRPRAVAGKRHRRAAAGAGRARDPALPTPPPETGAPLLGARATSGMLCNRATVAPTARAGGPAPARPCAQARALSPSSSLARPFGPAAPPKIQVHVRGRATVSAVGAVRDAGVAALSAPRSNARCAQSLGQPKTKQKNSALIRLPGGSTGRPPRPRRSAGAAHWEHGLSLLINWPTIAQASQSGLFFCRARRVRRPSGGGTGAARARAGRDALTATTAQDQSPIWSCRLPPGTPARRTTGWKQLATAARWREGARRGRAGARASGRGDHRKKT